MLKRWTMLCEILRWSMVQIESAVQRIRTLRVRTHDQSLFHRFWQPISRQIWGVSILFFDYLRSVHTMQIFRRPTCKIAQHFHRKQKRIYQVVISINVKKVKVLHKKIYSSLYSIINCFFLLSSFHVSTRELGEYTGLMLVVVYTIRVGNQTNHTEKWFTEVAFSFHSRVVRCVHSRHFFLNFCVVSGVHILKKATKKEEIKWAA